jgi:hypothetical protein
MQGTGKVVVWCVIWGNKTEHAAGQTRVENFQRIFSKTGHHFITVSKCGDGRPAVFGFLDWSSWSREWPKGSLDLSPVGLHLWGHLKAMVYREKTRNVNHLTECIRNAIPPWMAETHPCFQSNGNHSVARHLSARLVQTFPERGMSEFSSYYREILLIVLIL